MQTNTETNVSRYRALMTDTDRDYLSNDEYEGTEKRYQAVSRVRKRITEEVPQDVEVLAEHYPGLLEDLREVVCKEESE